MKKVFWMLPAVAASLALTGQPARAENSCGSQGLVCSDEERCCEHQVAIFMDGAASGPSYVEGKCLSKEQRCGDYWCGNRHCQGGLFGTPSVCCVTTVPGMSSEYRCAYSELSCPGNSDQLTIRNRNS